MTITTVVVGIDGSPGCSTALRLAIDEAALRHGRVKVVVCWSERPGNAGARRRMSRTARATAERTAVGAGATSGERAMLVVEAGVGELGPELVRLSRAAALLVVSTTLGHGPDDGPSATVEHCLRHSHVPVVVVPRGRTGRVEALGVASTAEPAPGPVDDPLAWLDHAT